MENMKENYYVQNLNAQKLFQVYDTKISRIKQYLKSEISFVQKKLQGSESVLELGAGYGRIMKELAPYCNLITGIDISKENVDLARAYLRDLPNTRVEVMDAHRLSFQERFDVILCLQNAMSAMRVEPIGFVKEITALLADGGTAYFSSYDSKFWEYRLDWFREQACKGLLGEIDEEKTKDGVILCKDGFTAKTHSLADMEAIGKSSGYEYVVTEVDESSVFLIINKG